MIFLSISISFWNNHSVVFSEVKNPLRARNSSRSWPNIRVRGSTGLASRSKRWTPTVVSSICRSKCVAEPTVASENTWRNDSSEFSRSSTVCRRISETSRKKCRPFEARPFRWRAKSISWGEKKRIRWDMKWQINWNYKLGRKHIRILPNYNTISAWLSGFHCNFLIQKFVSCRMIENNC